MSNLLIRAKGLYDGEGGRLTPEAFVLIQGETIAAAGPRDREPPLPPGTRIVDRPESFLLPGLINSHAHICLPSGGRPLDVVQSDQEAALQAAANIRTELQSGVTTVKDCGDRNGVTFAVREAVRQGLHPGPRLLLCGPPLTVTGGHCCFFGGEADGAAGLARAAAERAALGADFIKVMATGGGTPGSHPELAAYTADELTAAVRAAHEAGVPLSAHCRGVPGIENAVAAGVDQIEHACFELPGGRLKFEPRLAEAMAAKGVAVTPTIQLYRDVFGHLTRKKEAGDITPEENARLEGLPQVLEEKWRALRGLVEAGVLVVAGVDAGLPHTGFGLFWKELEAMAAGGLSFPQVLDAATINGARAMGLQDQIGSIRPGKKADVILVGRDPAQDLSVLGRPEMVILNGEPQNLECL